MTEKLTLAQLQADYRTAYRILRAEKQMRLYVFRNDTTKMLAKVGEIDRLLAILERWKDELKTQLAPQQPELFGAEQKEAQRLD